MNVLTSNATLPVVLSYIRKGWRVVPIPRGSKAPKINRWQLLQITEAEAPRYFDHACNIGVILDNGLVDGDLDCSEAIDLAPEILPPTTAIFGRRSKPESHWLYRVKGAAPAEKFTDPLTGEMLVELRGNGGLQTIFPGSIHPSGELVEWFNDEAFDDELPTPTEVEADTLRKAFRKLAACSLIRRYYKNAEDVIDDQCVEQAIRELDPRVGERVRIWLGMQPSANLSLSSQPMNGLRELPEYLKYETHHGPTVSERLEDSLRTAWSPAEQSRLQTALTAIDVKSCGYEDFLKIGFALHDLKWDRADGTSIGFELWDAWCSLSEHYNQAGLGSKWQSFERSARSGVTTGTVFHMAKERGWSPPENPNSSLATRPEAAVQGQAQETPHPDQGVSLNDFYAYMPKHAYIFVPSRDLWPPSSVDSRLGAIPLFNRDGTPKLDQKSGKQQTITAHLWLDQNRHVEQMTWAPGLPLLIPNRLISEGGWLEHEGAACFNLYRPPNIELGNAAEAHRWLNHVRKVYDESAGHIVQWLAHRVQHPSVKINHALVLGGNQGIGKDTLLEPAKYAVGPWNFSEVSPQQLLGRFNGFLKSVILRVSEARDLGEANRFSFYDHMKAYTAAPPDVLRVDEKFLNEHSILNCCGVIITTNHKADGIYLPADDRRHYVAWSELSKDDFTPAYWNELWNWYNGGGYSNVAAYLRALDISGFDAKAPPPKTSAFWAIVDASRAPEEAELADALDRLGNPDATTIDQLSVKAAGDFRMWITDRKNRRSIPHRLEKCGYIPVRNGGAQDGLWVINGSRQVVYAKKDLPLSAQFKAAELLKPASQPSIGRNS
jgi:Bifunctional DNA primase/polymerase, N-terminal/Primase C terminal 2 (PriCT-2)/Family of unknown function (DUF5906)